MKKILLVFAVIMGTMAVSKADTKLATFVIGKVEYELYQDLLVISDFEMTRAIKFDSINLVKDHYRMNFPDPSDRLTFIKNKNDKYTLVGEIDGEDIKVKELVKL